MRGDLWGRFFDFRPRQGVFLSLPLSVAFLSVCPRINPRRFVAESGDTAKLSEASGLKVDRRFIRRGKKKGWDSKKGDCKEEARLYPWLRMYFVLSFFSFLSLSLSLSLSRPSPRCRCARGFLPILRMFSFAIFGDRRWRRFRMAGGGEGGEM